MDRRNRILHAVLIAVMALAPYGSAMAATTIGNNVAVGGTLGVTGATTLTGAATLSSTLSVASLATLTSGFISAASSSVSAGLQVAGALSASSTLGVAGATTLAGTVTVSADIVPGSNNTRDLGAFGTAFKNVYVSTTMTAVSSTIVQPSITSTLFLNSGAAQSGGRIIFKGANGTTCYQLYFGTPNGDAGAVVGLATSTISCPN